MDNFVSSPSPSQSTTTPSPYFACLTCVPSFHRPRRGRGAEKERPEDAREGLAVWPRSRRNRSTSRGDFTALSHEVRGFETSDSERNGSRSSAGISRRNRDGWGHPEDSWPNQ